MINGKWITQSFEMDITFAKQMFGSWRDPLFELEDYDEPVCYDTSMGTGRVLSVNGMTSFPEYGSDGGIVSTRSFRVPFHITPGGQSCTV